LTDHSLAECYNHPSDIWQYILLYQKFF